jgi:8-oxo-dGTP pyrophosphatase MutT (NUDIX family)
MARGKAVTAVLAAAGIATGVVLWRRRSRRLERVDLYFADGSMVSFGGGSIEASRLLPLGEAVLDAARPPTAS